MSKLHSKLLSLSQSSMDTSMIANDSYVTLHMCELQTNICVECC